MARNRDTPRGFKLNAKQFFLTYPRSDNISLDELYSYLEQKIIAGTNVEKIVVAEEEHQDGGKHFHAYLMFGSKITIYNQNHFDFEGRHPNVQSARSPKAVVEYCTKDGNYKANFTIKLKRKPLSEVAAEIIDQGMGTQDSIEHLSQNGHADTAIKSYPSVRALTADRTKQSVACQPKKNYPDDFCLPEPLKERIDRWLQEVEDHVAGERDMKSLWLHGESRLGKTVLARSLGVHWYCQANWSMERIDESGDSKYGVFDDIEWESLKRNYKALLGMQEDVVLTDKYCKKKTFKYGCPVIVLSNDIPTFTYEEEKWLNHNIEFVKIDNKLY